MSGFANKRVLLIGAGGLGGPVATLLARAGVGRIEVLDDDRIELSNLHRQVLYRPADVGAAKAVVAADCIARESCGDTCAVAREKRLEPDTALDAVRGFDLVVEGGDNYPTKFLASDACRIAHVPCVQAGAVRWVGWVMGFWPGRSACLRCAFEDIPDGCFEQGCTTQGAVGPVVGVVGALQASVALRLLRGEMAAAGVVHHYRGLQGTLRRTRVERGAHCPACNGLIEELHPSRYLPQECAA